MQVSKPFKQTKNARCVELYDLNTNKLKSKSNSKIKRVQTNDAQETNSYIMYNAKVYMRKVNSKELKIVLAAAGFEPAPPRRLVPKTSALDHSATLPASRELK
jgi:hypothetical protein